MLLPLPNSAFPLFLSHELIPNKHAKSHLLPASREPNLHHGRSRINISIINLGIHAALANVESFIHSLNAIIYSNALSQAFEHLNDRILVLDTLRKPNSKQRTAKVKIEYLVLFLKGTSKCR